MTEEFHVCNPCREGAHLECASSPQMTCQCLVCEGNRIGDEVVGEPMEIRWPIPDRLEPRDWRP